MLQFETDCEQAQLAKVQSLSDLRQLLGYESVPPDYDVAGPFDYQPVKGNVVAVTGATSVGRKKAISLTPLPL